MLVDGKVLLRMEVGRQWKTVEEGRCEVFGKKGGGMGFRLVRTVEEYWIGIICEPEGKKRYSSRLFKNVFSVIITTLSIF